MITLQIIQPGQAARPEHESGRFSLSQAKKIVGDCFTRNPIIYWTDFLASAAVGYGFAASYLLARPSSAQQIVSFLISGLALFRAGTFMHEIIHMSEGAMRGFKIAWNIIFGIPMLTPSLMYRSHADHHSVRLFGTPADGEYLPLGVAPTPEILRFFAQVPILPFLVVFRFLVLTPLSFLHPGLRQWVMERASSAVCNPYYRRRIPPAERQGLWLLMEWACFAYLVVILGLVLAGTIPLNSLALVYLLATYGAGLNWARNLAAHRYRNDGNTIDLRAQLLDSINIVGQGWLTALLFPVGLNYHALHHLFPTLPYHAMRRAHRRLMAELPADSPYRKTVYKNYWQAVTDLWRSAKTSEVSEAMAVWRQQSMHY
jgi:fatty acid desaturase